MAEASPPLLELAGIRVRRGRQEVLAGVDLSLAPGELHVLLGPNGAGKSTLLEAILGRVAFEGTARLHARRDGRLAYVPQRFESDLTLALTVMDFLALSRQRRPVCLGIARAMRAQGEALLERVGLVGFGGRALGELSGGELRRVLLANALDPAPELLLLDEPASGLDPAAQERLEVMVRELAEVQRTAVVLVAHDLAQARRLAHRVTVLDRRVVRTGKPDEVLAEGAAGWREGAA